MQWAADLSVPVTVVWGERFVGKPRSLVSSGLMFDIGRAVDQSIQAHCCIPEDNPRNTSPLDRTFAHLTRLSRCVQRRILDHIRSQGAARLADKPRLGVLGHITVGVNGVPSFHHDLIVVDEDRTEGLISPGSSFDRKLYRSTKESGIGFRERHAATVSGSTARTVQPRTYPVSPQGVIATLRRVSLMVSSIRGFVEADR